MIMICNVPDEVVKSVKMGTWCGSSVAEKMIANGIPLDKIRAEIIELRSRQNVGVLECLDIIDKYKAEMEKNE